MILFLNDTEGDYHFGCTATCRAIKRQLAELLPAEEIVSVGVQDIWKEGPNERILKLIREADEIFVNGEGTILGYDGRSGTKNLLALIEHAEEMGKRVSLINHSCFPYLSPYAPEKNQAIYRKIYSRLYRCVVRDIRSLAILNEIGIRNVSLGFDCSPLYVEKDFVEKPISLERGSYVLLSGGIDFAKSFEAFLEKTADSLIAMSGKKLVFLFSETEVTAKDDEKCVAAIEAYNKTARNAIEVYSAKDVDEFITVIKNAAYQITGRFHHSVIALSVGTPFLVLSTHSPKNEVFRDLLPSSMIDVAAATDGSLIPAVKRMLAADWGSIDREKIRELARVNFEPVVRHSELEEIADMAAREHGKTFLKYRNCHAGREMVVLASGPTLNYYTAKPGALHLGVNKVFYSGKAELDYLFMQDYIPSAQDDADNYLPGRCQKFYGRHFLVPAISDAHAEKAKAERYYFRAYDPSYSSVAFSSDLSISPLTAFASVIHPAVQFALWTGVKRIYLVGCDCSLGGYAQGLRDEDPSKNTLLVSAVIEGWTRLKEYARIFYPETEIVSINPVGLKGLFRDEYTAEYLAANHADETEIPVTVVTVVRNALAEGRETVFRQCLESVAAQRGVAVEHVIVDGASTDGTVDLIRAFAEGHPHVRWISEPDKSLYDAMNKGLALAKGRYIAFLNSDDFYHDPCGLADSVCELTRTGADFSWAPACVLRTDGEPWSDHPWMNPNPQHIFHGMPFSHQTVLVKTDLMRRMGGYDLTYRSAADYDFILRLVFEGAKPCFVSRQFVTFRAGGWSMTNAELSRREVGQIWSQLYKRYLGYAFSAEEGYRLYRRETTMPVDLIKNLDPFLIRSFGIERTEFVYECLLDLQNQLTQTKANLMQAYRWLDETKANVEAKKNDLAKLRQWLEESKTRESELTAKLHQAWKWLEDSKARESELKAKLHQAWKWLEESKARENALKERLRHDEKD